MLACVAEIPPKRERDQSGASGKSDERMVNDPILNAFVAIREEDADFKA